MTSDTKFFAWRMHNLKITCAVETDGFVPYVMHIEHDGKILNSTNHMEVSAFTCKYYAITNCKITLTIPKSSKARDKGNYKCIVIDSFNNANSVNANVTFITSSRYMLVLKNVEKIAHKSDPYAQFLFKFEAIPPATFYVLNPKGQQIARDSNVFNRKKYEVVFNRDIIKFRVKFPNVNDFGEYAMLWKGASGEKKTFKLIVVGK
jgi:hypothetical protein